MILLLARHRFLENIFSLRFTVTFVLCEILFAASALILAHEYRERLVHHREIILKSEDNLRKISTFSQLKFALYRPPSPLSVLCEGAERRLRFPLITAYDQAPILPEDFSRGESLSMWSMWHSLDGLIEDNTGRNPLMGIFPSFDGIMVVAVLLSLMVLFLSYNSISGEREQGTLHVILSNPAPRHSVLLGSFIGGMGSVVFALAAGFLTSLLVLSQDPLIFLNGGDYIRILMLFFLGILYLSLFYTLGMLFSVRVRSSATVLILLLFIWIITVIIVPNAAVYAAKGLVGIPEQKVLLNRWMTLRQEWIDENERYSEQHPAPINLYDPNRFSQEDLSYLSQASSGYSALSGNWPFRYSVRYAPREIIEWNFQGSVYGHNLRIQYEDRYWQFFLDYQRKLLEQTRLARLMSLLSPSRSFSHAVSLIAGTSDEESPRFYNQASDYRREVIRYMRSRGGLDGYSLFLQKPVSDFLSAREIVLLGKSRGMKAVEESVNYPEKPLDLRDMPRFRYHRESMGSAIVSAMPELGVLFFFTVFFFILSWVLFLRADVR